MPKITSVFGVLKYLPLLAFNTQVFSTPMLIKTMDSDYRNFRILLSLAECLMLLRIGLSALVAHSCRIGILPRTFR